MAERLYPEGLGARKFGSLNENTQQLVLAILGKGEPEDPHIGHMARNLRVSEGIVDAADSLFHESGLLGTWQEYFWLITHVCLPIFHDESAKHCQRVREIIVMLRRLIERHGLVNIPDYGIQEFRRVRETFIPLDDSDWDDITYAGEDHDVGKMGYEPEFWAWNGLFTQAQKEARKAHPRLAFPLGEMFGVPLRATALFLFHHFLNLHYPSNGYILMFQRFLQDPKFLQMLSILIMADCFDGMRGPRAYRSGVLSFEQVMKWIVKELGEIGPGMLPLLWACHETGELGELYVN